VAGTAGAEWGGSRGGRSDGKGACALPSARTTVQAVIQRHRARVRHGSPAPHAPASTYAWPALLPRRPAQCSSCVCVCVCPSAPPTRTVCAAAPPPVRARSSPHCAQRHGGGGGGGGGGQAPPLRCAPRRAAQCSVRAAAQEQERGAEQCGTEQCGRGRRARSSTGRRRRGGAWPWRALGTVHASRAPLAPRSPHSTTGAPHTSRQARAPPLARRLPRGHLRAPSSGSAP